MTKNVIYQTLDKNSNKNIYYFCNFIHENIKQDKLIPHPTDKNWFMIADDYVFEFLLTFGNEIQELSPIVVPVLRNIMPTVLANDIIGVQPMQAPDNLIHSLRVRYENKIDFSDPNENQ